MATKEGQTAWLIWERDYNDAMVVAAFTTEALAKQYVAERDDFTENAIEPLEILGEALGRKPYYHFGASVYPDGTVDRWDQEHESDDTDWLEDVDAADRLHDRDEPWDGHTQGHCGFHVSVFGRDRDKTEAARERWVKKYLLLCDGTCPTCGRTENYVTNCFPGPQREVPVTLRGGPRDGEVVPTLFYEDAYDVNGPVRPPMDALICLSVTYRNGESADNSVTYGCVKRDGDEWIRECVGEKA